MFNCSLCLASTQRHRRCVRARSHSVAIELFSITLRLKVAPEPSCQLYVFLHNRHPLGVDRTQVGIFKQMDQVRFAGLLEGQNGIRLPPDTVVDPNIHLSNLLHKSSKRQLAQQKISGSLVLADFAQRIGAGPIPSLFGTGLGRRIAR